MDKICYQLESWQLISRKALTLDMSQKTGEQQMWKQYGEKFKASNYRPVSLTSVCCKIQKHVITSNILNHLDDHNILTDCQHNFRAKRSCETQLLTLAQELVSSLGRKHQHDLGSSWIKTSKAFDHIPHECLMRKLDIMGLQEAPAVEYKPFSHYENTPIQIYRNI